MRNLLAVATFSWARTPEERLIILKTLQALSNLGMPVIVVDKKNSLFPIIEQVKSFDNILACAGNSLDERMKKAFTAASEHGEFIFFCESDKQEFAEQYAKSLLAAFNERPEGTWLPVRTRRSFLSYPRFQQVLEESLWRSTAKLLGQEVIDVSYGPRVFPGKLVPYLHRSKELTGFGFQYYLLALNHRLGLPMHTIEFEVTLRWTPKFRQVAKRESRS